MTEQWIATRRLTDDGGGTIDVSVGVPRPSDAPETMPWRCPIRYVVGDQVVDKLCGGMDAFQALYNALEKISRELECKQFAWSPECPGWADFPRIVGGDPKMVDLSSVYKIIDDEIDRQMADFVARKRAAAEGSK
jgi:hypothetical protein